MASDSSDSEIEMLKQQKNDLKTNFKMQFRTKDGVIRETEFNPLEGIFFKAKAEPLSSMKKTESCRSCRYKFKSKNEMVMC